MFDAATLFAVAAMLSVCRYAADTSLLLPHMISRCRCCRRVDAIFHAYADIRYEHGKRVTRYMRSIAMLL